MIDLSPLDYAFAKKPLLIGGKAMEFYGLRQAGEDIDFVVTASDYVGLARKYPEDLKEIYGDLGVIVGRFELWKTILLFEYNFLSREAIEQPGCKIISMEKLLFLKTMASSEDKYAKDAKMIVQKILHIQYGNDPDYPSTYFND